MALSEELAKLVEAWWDEAQALSRASNGAYEDGAKATARELATQAEAILKCMNALEMVIHQPDINRSSTP